MRAWQEAVGKVGSRTEKQMPEIVGCCGVFLFGFVSFSSPLNMVALHYPIWAGSVCVYLAAISSGS